MGRCFYSKLMTENTFRGSRFVGAEKEASERARYGLKTLPLLPRGRTVSKNRGIRELLEDERKRKKLIFANPLDIRAAGLCTVVYCRSLFRTIRLTTPILHLRCDCKQTSSYIISSYSHSASRWRGSCIHSAPGQTHKSLSDAYNMRP